MFFSLRQNAYSQFSSIKNTQVCSHKVQIGTHTDGLFDSSCLLIDDSSGMEMIHIPPAGAAQSGPTCSLHTSSCLIPSFYQFFLPFLDVCLAASFFSLQTLNSCGSFTHFTESSVTSALLVKKSNSQRPIITS